MTAFKHTNSQLFFWNNQQAVPAALAANYTVAFFWKDNFTTLKESWTQSHGVYLFLKSPQSGINQSRLTQQLKELLAQPFYRNVRFLWIDNPTAHRPAWQTYQLAVSEDGKSIDQLSYLDIRNHSLSISRGCTIGLNQAENGFAISRNSNAQGFEWSTGYGRHRMYNFSAPSGATEELQLSMSGATVGTLRTGFSAPKVSAGNTYAYPDLGHLDIGMRIFMRDPEFPDTDAVFDVSAHRFPLFDELGDHVFGTQYYPDKIGFDVQLDPLHPLDGERSFFAVLPGDTRQQQLGLPSGYRTNLGYIVHLIPRTGAKLVFNERLVESDMAATAPLYLVPSGNFEMKVPRYQSDGSINPADFVDDLVCGISGLEYIKLTNDQRDLIRFEPGGAAFAPTYFSLSAALRMISAQLQEISQGRERHQLIQNLLLGDLSISASATFTVRKAAEKIATWRDVVLPKMNGNLYLNTFDISQNGVAAFGERSRTERVEQWRSAMSSYLKSNFFSNDFDMEAELGDVFEDPNQPPNGAQVKAWVSGQLQQISQQQGEDQREAILTTLEIELLPPGFQLDPKLRPVFNELETEEEFRKWLEEAFAKMSYPAAGGLLTDLATTSYAYVRQEPLATATTDTEDDSDPAPAAQPVYYAQPELAVLHQGGAENFFEFLEVPAMGLPGNLSQMVFPMLPYGQADPDILSDYKVLEATVVARVRSDQVLEVGKADGFNTPLLAPDVTLPDTGWFGTTPQGLLAKFSPDFKTWERLVLGRGAKYENNKKAPAAEVAFTDIAHGDVLKNTFQTNPLFLVISKEDTLASYFTENQLEIEGWTFDLATESWPVIGAKPETILIFKFQEKPLIQLVADPKNWTQAAHFNRNPREISRQAVEILQNAIEAANSDDIRARKKYESLARVAQAEAWTGILALNVEVPLRGLPDELMALAAGIDEDKFYGQYVSIEVTPIKQENDILVTNYSSLFGLIDYKNDYVANADTYDFHVTFLTVVFNNSEVSDFAAEVLVKSNTWFSEPALLLEAPAGRENVIVLKGTAEKHGGKTTYAFGFSGANHFLLSNSTVIDELEIVKVTFVTDPITRNADGTLPDPLPVTGRFFFWSRLRFALKEEFDILSFGPEAGDDPPQPDYLSFSNLQLEMSFRIIDNGKTTSPKTFTMIEDRLSFDLKRSGHRKQSLYEKFPLLFTGWKVLGSNAQQRLTSEGYLSVTTPLANGLGSSAYAMIFDLNMGTPGALGGKAALIGKIVVAWSPSSQSNGVFVGLQLPGSKGGEKEILIQGIMKLGFDTIVFEKVNVGEDSVGYLLKLQNLLLQFFKLSLPPIGGTEIILFGDPRDDVQKKDKLLGWYAAYAQD